MFLALILGSHMHLVEMFWPSTLSHAMDSLAARWRMRLWAHGSFSPDDDDDVVDVVVCRTAMYELTRVLAISVGGTPSVHYSFGEDFVHIERIAISKTC